MSLSKNLVVVFHAYPQKPCVDGLLGASLYVKYLAGNAKAFLVPCWRTPDSFQHLKKVVDGLAEMEIVYFDCCPLLEEEKQFLEESKSSGKVTSLKVIDHHPSPQDLKDWMSKNCDKVTCDLNRCASKIVADDVGGKLSPGLQLVVGLCQFCDYEGQADELCQGKKLHKDLKDSLGSIADREIVEWDLLTYYFLDHLLPEREGWEFIYTGEEAGGEMMKKEIDKFAENCQLAMQKHTNLFTEDKVQAYKKKLAEAKEKLEKESRQVKMQVGDKEANVLVVKMSIAYYGRSLEPLVRERLRENGAQYAVMINPPTAKGDDVNYYLSLRRIDDQEGRSAALLVQALKSISGSNIGGGHPWASAVNLNQAQYEKMARDLNLQDTLVPY